MSIKIKSGMAGSRNGRSRWIGTEWLKTISKKVRRSQGKRVIKEATK